MAQPDEMRDRELLTMRLEAVSPGFREHDGPKLMLRNGRWGTCVDCPRDQEGVHPEHCVNTDRYDHNIHSTSGGRFFKYGDETSLDRIN